MEEDIYGAGTESQTRSRSTSGRGGTAGRRDLVSDLIEEGVDYVEEKFEDMNFDWKKVLGVVAIIGAVGALSALAMNVNKGSSRSHRSSASSKNR